MCSIKWESRLKKRKHGNIFCILFFIIITINLLVSYILILKDRNNIGKMFKLRIFYINNWESIKTVLNQKYKN